MRNRSRVFYSSGILSRVVRLTLPVFLSKNTMSVLVPITDVRCTQRLGVQTPCKERMPSNANDLM